MYKSNARLICFLLEFNSMYPRTTVLFSLGVLFAFFSTLSLNCNAQDRSKSSPTELQKKLEDKKNEIKFEFEK